MQTIADNIFPGFIFHSFINSICCDFPFRVKKADVIPIFKKKDNNENYRPLSIFPMGALHLFFIKNIFLW